MPVLRRSWTLGNQTSLRQSAPSPSDPLSPSFVLKGTRAQRALRLPLLGHPQVSSQMSFLPRVTCWVTSSTWTLAPQ